MEGYSRNQCIARQRQINGAYYQEEKNSRRPPITSAPSTGVKRLNAAPTDEVVEEQAYESNAKAESTLRDDDIVRQHFNANMAMP